MKELVKLQLVAASLAAFATGTVANEVGKAEYLNSCASCHGATGHGDGPIATHMSTEVPDLTTLTMANDGEFPVFAIMEMIDGRNEVEAHGREMPAWGDRYMQDLAETETGFRAELVIRGRMWALVEYLQSIQN